MNLAQSKKDILKLDDVFVYLELEKKNIKITIMSLLIA